MAQQTARLPPPWGHWAGHVLASSPPLTPTEMVGRGRFLNSWILKNDAESHSETVLLSRSPTDDCSFIVRGRAVAWEENLQKPVLHPFNKIKKQAAEKKIQSSRTLGSQRGPREDRLSAGRKPSPCSRPSTFRGGGRPQIYIIRNSRKKQKAVMGREDLPPARHPVPN